MTTPRDTARTTIAQLVYPARPVLNFARLVADLDSALGGLAALDRTLAWDHDDVAILDLGSSRIALSMTEGPAPGGVTISVAAGWGPIANRDARLAERRQAVARLIADRISSRFTPARTLWRESEEVATADLLDQLVDQLDVEAAAPPARLNPAPARRTGMPSHRPAKLLTRLEAQEELPRLLERCEGALAQRAEPGSGVPPLEVANDEPDLPRARTSGLEAVRGALYAGPEDYESGPSPALRLAAHSLDATLLVVALPVGAAMMTYSLVRGGDLRASGRMMALCGIGLGAMHSLAAAGGIGAFLPFAA